MTTNTLSPELLHSMDAYWRAANYLSVGRIYLYDNPLLKRPADPLGREAHAARALGNSRGRVHQRERLPQTGDKGLSLKRHLKEKLMVHKQYIDKYGEDLPEVRQWRSGTSRGEEMRR